MPTLTDWLMERAAQTDPAPGPAPLQHAWFKVKGMTVHVDGRGLPHPCVRCRDISEFLCDYPVTPGVTCNAPLCPACAKPIGPDRHLCPLHVKVIENRKGPLL